MQRKTAAPKEGPHRCSGKGSRDGSSFERLASLKLESAEMLTLRVSIATNLGSRRNPADLRGQAFIDYSKMELICLSTISRKRTPSRYIFASLFIWVCILTNEETWTWKRMDKWWFGAYHLTRANESTNWGRCGWFMSLWVCKGDGVKWINQDRSSSSWCCFFTNLLRSWTCPSQYLAEAEWHMYVSHFWSYPHTLM